MGFVFAHIIKGHWFDSAFICDRSRIREQISGGRIVEDMQSILVCPEVKIFFDNDYPLRLGRAPCVTQEVIII